MVIVPHINAISTLSIVVWNFMKLQPPRTMIGEVANIFVNVQALSIASFWCWEPLLHSHHSPRTPSQVPLFYHFWCVDRGPDLYDSVDEHPFLNIIPIDPRRFYQSYWDSTRTIAGWWLSKTTPLQKMMDWVRQLGTFPTEWKVIIHSCSKPPIRIWWYQLLRKQTYPEKKLEHLLWEKSQTT